MSSSAETQKSAGKATSQQELREKMRREAQEAPLTKEGMRFMKKAQAKM
ncbi:MAG: hypothetical protein LPH21_12045 [Shewanella sp.]|nr:hypothetical protein [Shewanella sp.]MCG7936975.1 hypothetical protein [Candidatus Thiodiazotropha taylori]